MKPFVLEVPSRANDYAVATEDLPPIRNLLPGIPMATTYTTDPTPTRSSQNLPFPTGTNGGQDSTTDWTSNTVTDDNNGDSRADDYDT